MTARIKEVGACGNYCAGCRDFRVLAENDDALRQQVAENLTKELGRLVLPEEVGCEGCWGGIHNNIAASPECRIRQCAEAQDFATCAECADFPCQIFAGQFGAESEYADNIRGIQKLGLVEWNNKKKEEIKCRTITTLSGP